MTPKEKVEELIEKLESETNSLIKDELAIKCLIFMVNEIINLNALSAEYNGVYVEYEDLNLFWKEVREELINRKT